MSKENNRIHLRPCRSRFSTLAFTCVLCLVVLGLWTPSVAQQITDIHDFGFDSGDGDGPGAPMIAGPNGVLYGTTQFGGDLTCAGGFDFGCGIIFQLAPSGSQWNFSTLYEFTGEQDGLNGATTLAIDGAGNLYGPTNRSTTPYDAIFELTPGAPGQPWNFSLIYSFRNQDDGAHAISPLFIDATGAIYGATLEGGTKGRGCYQSGGCGAIFQLVPPAQPGGAWTEHTLYQFQGARNGGNPGTLFMDSTGTIYGTTNTGGTFACSSGCGVAFQLKFENGAWTYTVIHRFNPKTGELPYGNLVGDAQGALYGLAFASQEFAGNIFRLSPPTKSKSWKFTSIYSYTNAYPPTNLTIGTNGVLYGDIYGDQDGYPGYVFQLAPSGRPGKWKYETLYDFSTYMFGANPDGVLAYGGNLYVSMTDGGYSPGNIDLIVP